MTSLTNTDNHYGSVAILLHWGMAILIFGMLGLGLYMTGLPIGIEKLKYYGWHKATGIVVLGLVMFRMVWRIVNRQPLLPGDMPVWQKKVAHAVHFFLYGGMVAMPLSGWLMSSAAGFPVSVYGLFVLPGIIAPDKGMHHLFETVHTWLAYGLMGALMAHIGAAFFHHLVLKDKVLRSMMP